MNLLLKVISIILFYIGLVIPLSSFCYDLCLTKIEHSALEIIYNSIYLVDVNFFIIFLVIINVTNLFFILKSNSLKNTAITMNVLSIIFFLALFLESPNLATILDDISNPNIEPIFGSFIIILSNLLFIISYQENIQKYVSVKKRVIYFVFLIVVFAFVNINFHSFYIKNGHITNSPKICDLSNSHLEYNFKTGKQDCVLNEQNKENPQ